MVNLYEKTSELPLIRNAGYYSSKYYNRND